MIPEIGMNGGRKSAEWILPGIMPRIVSIILMKRSVLQPVSHNTAIGGMKTVKNANIKQSSQPQSPHIPAHTNLQISVISSAMINSYIFGSGSDAR